MCAKNASKFCILLIYKVIGFCVGLFCKIVLLFYYSGLIDEEPLRFRGEVYHGYHFNCTACGQELDSTAREVKSRPGLAANDMVSWNIKA